MGYQLPTGVKSPKNAVSHLRVLYDGGEQKASISEWDGWSIAELEWHEQPVLACRWNGSDADNSLSPIGYPQASGQPLWFILPKPLEDVIRERLKDAPDRDREHALTRGAAEASAPAFSAVWDNPEDDVYDAL